ncbi:hypothetical protein LCGC14_0263290 [marine sediment metagenome]|uniref:Glycosyl transferase family 1 domain-containing protein n=1 Tax=marine sediment metagenome TaxID=412755 RepID=A0A0F9U624_9ZZZZ
MISLYCTADTIGTETGGGIVTKNELEALKSVSEVGLVLERDSIIPSRFQQPDSPFLFDYFALEQICTSTLHFDIAHFYSGTFTLSVKHLKEKGTKVSYMVPAHDREDSIAEFLKLRGSYPYVHIRDDNLWRIFSEGYRLADVVIAPSTKSAELFKSEGCRNMIVIPHGTNLPKDVKPLPDRFDVGYLGALGPDKGVIYLVQAWTMLNYSDSRLILAGSGTEALAPEIRNIAAEGLFVLLGRVASPSDLYNVCSVYCQPSVTEGFGIEVLEAMAHGRPVIVSEGAGASDLVDDGVTGFVVPIRSPEAIAERINQLKALPSYELAEMGQKAMRKARNFTWGRIRKRYARLFTSL